jgi:hypothetical protein
MQLSYGQTLTAALLGMIYGISRNQVVKSMSNNSFNKNKWTVTVTAADIETKTTITLPSGLTKTYTTNTAGATKTTTELATALGVLLNADTAITPYVVITTSTNTVIVEMKTTGQSFAMVAAANSTVAETTAATTTVSIPFGRGVCYDGANKCKVMASGGSFAGVALRDIGQINAGTSSSNVYDAGKTVSVLQKGEVWVTAMEAVVAGETAYCSHASGSEGQFRNDNTNALATGGTFTSSAGIGELVRVLL